MLSAMRGTIAFIAAVLTLGSATSGYAESRAAREALVKYNREFMPLYQQGKHKETAALCEETLAVFERELGPDHQYTLIVTSNLALEYQALGRLSEAERLAKRALAGDEQALGPDDPGTLTSVNNLAFIYQGEGRYEEAEPLYKRALAGRERALGRTHESTLESVNNLGTLYMFQGRYAEAEPLLKYALAVRERTLNPSDSDVLVSLDNLAGLYIRQKRYAEAEPLFRRSLSGQLRVFGPEHPNTVGDVMNLGLVYYFQARYTEAEALLKRALALKERDLGPLHTDPLTLRHTLAEVYFAQRDWAQAANYGRHSAMGFAKLIERSETDQGQALTGKIKQQTGHQDEVFWGFVKAAYRQGMAGGTQDGALAGEAFQTAQWAAASEAAQSLTQMAARGAAGDPKLAALVRARQDLIAEWHRLDGLRNAALGQPKQRRDLRAEAENQAQLNVIDMRVADIDRRLKEQFPDYAALTSPGASSVEEVQAQLRPYEALVLFLDTPELKPAPEETFVWVVTKTDLRWVSSPLGRTALAKEVQALRCGLDSSAWEASRGTASTAPSGAASCQELLGRAAPNGGFLPFDLSRSYALYQALLGQVEDAIQGKQLLVVPSGPLTALPFQVLVTKEPASAIPSDAKGYAAAKWLGQRQSITVLPSVASLKALRRHAGKSAASNPYIGFGNPLLTGLDGSDRSAWAVQNCKALSDRVVVASARGLAQPFSRLYKPGADGVADVEVLRRQPPLPDTADELCAVARLLGARPENVYLGANATEAKVAALSAEGALAKARVIHFATHGLVAGETAQIARASKAEPALLLTPPQIATEEDDGLLTASEVAALKLDADWVILSACNTASGGEKGGEALSGLARAFFYAGARALLVSHWYVDSAATVELITGAFNELAAHPQIGRAEAMRRAMAGLIARGDRNAHPANWAPFVVVGEGAPAG